jgi:glycosyltransferase involved in cell wall biosynthesis
VDAITFIAKHGILKICFLVDARSPIARNWIGYFIGQGHDTYIISTYPCSPDDFPQATLYEVPVTLANFSRTSQNRKASSVANSQRKSGLASLQASLRSKLSLAVQHCLLPFDVERHIRKVNQLFEQISPDLVHAMRIPFEGILAAKAIPSELPLLISVWGNDFTLWASRNPIIAGQTEEALQRADALHCDCERDLKMAIRDWQFNAAKLATILPGSGGIETALFNTNLLNHKLKKQLDIPDDAPVIINPRGVRSFIRNDIFFEAIPRVLRAYPKAIFLCVGMHGNALAENWIDKLSIQNNVRLLPSVAHEEMADLFRLASITVSPSLHDGTPNSLLEAMACGCFPVAGDIESVREWITHQSNGLLCDATDQASLAEAIIHALKDKQLRNTALETNLRLISERAEYHQVMQKAEAFYHEIRRYKKPE